MKYLSFLPAVALALSLGACGTGEQEEEPPAPGETSDPTAETVERPAEYESWEEFREGPASGDEREAARELWAKIEEAAPDLHPEHHRAVQACVELTLQETGQTQEQAIRDCVEDLEDQQPEDDNGEDAEEPADG